MTLYSFDVFRCISKAITPSVNESIYIMTYYIYQRSEYGFVRQLGFAFDKKEAIEKAKRYASGLYGSFTIEVHANGVRSEKIFEQTASGEKVI